MTAFDDLNSVQLEGVLLRDADMGTTATGKTLARFVLMTTSSYFKDGKRIESVAIVDVEAWGGSAEPLRDRGTHGTRIRLSGRLSQDRGEDGGGRHGRLKVVADRVVLSYELPSAPKTPAPPIAPTGVALPVVSDTLPREQAAERMHTLLEQLVEKSGTVPPKVSRSSS